MLKVSEIVTLKSKTKTNEDGTPKTYTRLRVIDEEQQEPQAVVRNGYTNFEIPNSLIASNSLQVGMRFNGKLEFNEETGYFDVLISKKVTAPALTEVAA